MARKMVPVGAAFQEWCTLLMYCCTRQVWQLYVVGICPVFTGDRAFATAFKC